MMCTTFLARALALASLCLLAGAPARAETTKCDGAGAPGSGAGQINNGNVPFTITAPGVYCVTQKITTNLTASSSAAITINANNVLLDMNDFAIGNLNAGPSTLAIGIYAVDRQNIHVRNGTLRGFYVGVALLNGTQVGLTTAASSGHTVENMLSDTNYIAGLAAEGPYVTVQNNKVINTQGSGLTSPLIPNAGNGANGIVVGGGAGILVAGNSVVDTDCVNACSIATANVQGIGIQPNSYGAVIRNNIITNQTISAAGNGAHGINFGSGNGTAASSNSLAQGNVLMNWGKGINFCNNGTAVCTGDLISNIAVVGVATPYAGGASPTPTVGTNF